MSRTVALALLGCCLLPASASAADPVLDQKRARAEQLETDARLLRDEAARTFGEEEAACRTRILVNDCINTAKEIRLEKIIRARQIEAEQATLSREIRYAEHAARREAKARRRAKDGPPPAVVIKADPPKVEATPLQ